MRIPYLLAALMLFNAGATLAADLVVPRLPGAVDLDGRLAEPQWRQAARLPSSAFDKWVADTYKKDPSPFVVRLFHDGSLLYVSLASYDRFVEADALAQNSDGLYSFSIITRTGTLQHYRLRWEGNPPVAGGEMLSPGKWGARLRGPFADRQREGGGYVLEFSIPLTGTGARAGDTVPINIIVQDHDGNPNGRYNDPGAEFARFFWGSLDNENRAAYRTIKLAP
jgi:hypothetical protein